MQQPTVTELRFHLALTIDATLGAVQVSHRNRKPFDPVGHSPQQTKGTAEDRVAQVGMAGVVAVQQIDAHGRAPEGMNGIGPRGDGRVPDTAQTFR